MRREHAPFDAGHCCDGCRRRTAAGFTLVELVMTMIVVGILAVAVLPRFADVGVFEARGLRDETLSLLRYAQKSAVAQRRTVCVAVNPTGISLTIDTATMPDGSCDGPLTLPVTPRGGSGLGSTHATFNFLASGAASDNVTLTITEAADIKVDAATGYVR
ncbi:MAG: prepilin-type N-terminal cleavage/methylation domain-containing protein [Gallionella sp.]|nr:prepilin-type N-terminal cleavage/methylation domain-containing protein [Gallionella sp.]